MCIEDSRLRACSLASNKKANQNSGAKHALCDKEWTPVFFMIAGVNFALILSPLRGPASISTNSFFLCLYHIPQPLSECSCIRVLHPACHISSTASVNGSRGIRARQNNFQVPKIQSWDTSPADRSLRSRVMMGMGLMVRNMILLRNQFSASLALFWNLDFC